MRITVIRAWPGLFDEVPVDLPAGARIADALAKTGWSADALAVFGIRATPDTLLHDGDRIEVLRPLEADPKQARRTRAGASRANASRPVPQGVAKGTAEGG